MHRCVDDCVCVDVRRHHNHRYTNTQSFEIEVILSYSVVVELGRVWWCSGRRNDVIVAAAMFVESDDEQSILPVVPAGRVGIANCLIDFPNDPVAEPHTAWAAIRIDH